jgi:hypothetical protein
MDFPFDIVSNIITRAMAAFDRIKRDPVGFLKNLLRAIKQGFVQFFENILRHLLNGLADWVFFQLKDLGIQKPEDLSFKSILKLVIDVLGISVQRIMDKVWKKLEEKIGKEKVEKIKRMIDKLEGIWKFIRDVIERGPVAIWEFIQEKLSTLWSTILDAAKNFIMERIIGAVVTKLLSMLDPTGIMAVVNSVIAIYRAIQSFIAYLRQMLEIVNSFVEGVAEIAAGNIRVAANFIERTAGRAIPIIIGFLANQVGLGKIADKLKEIIEKIREKIDLAIDWLVDKAVNMGMSIMNRLLAMGRSARDAVLGWLGIRQRFTTPEGEEHNLYFTGTAGSARLMIASNPTPFETFIGQVEISATDPHAGLKEHHKQNALRKARAIDGLRNDTTMDEAAKNRAIAMLIQELSESTKHLFGGDLPMCGEPDHNPSSDDNTRFAHYMNIKPLTRRGLSIGSGSKPTSASHSIYRNLEKRRHGDGSYYVKGHLLNQGLKGAGGWRNLTPLSQAGNSAHESTVESLVKAAVDSGAIVEYKVIPVYQSRGDKSALLAQTTDQDVIDIIHAEDHVPIALRSEAYRLNKQLQRISPIIVTSVINPVDRSIRSYNTHGGRTPEIYLSDKIPNQISGVLQGKIDVAFIQLVTRKIIQALNVNPQIRVFQNLANALDFSDDLRAASNPQEIADTQKEINKIKLVVANNLQSSVVHLQHGV